MSVTQNKVVIHFLNREPAELSAENRNPSIKKIEAGKQPNNKTHQ